MFNRHKLAFLYLLVFMLFLWGGSYILFNIPSNSWYTFPAALTITASAVVSGFTSLFYFFERK